MRKMILAAMALVAATAVHARNEAVMLPLADVVKLGLEQGKLDGSVSFHLSGASTPAISEKLGDDVSNKKTNGVGKDDATACNWAALSALMAFEAKAKQKGANAVVDLHSFNKKQSTRDPINFECRAGNVMAGVTFKGTYARVGR
ncbi:excinuclease ATPase subunit [Delftia tsuruhatensis]|uniref:excinuclease ATPase subunit n=1 Tax=Delftia tsuruhatensis TaxID=180282 RepID=UPI00312C8860